MTKIGYLSSGMPMWITTPHGSTPEAVELARQINCGEFALPEGAWKRIPPPDPPGFHAAVDGSVVTALPHLNSPNITPRQREVMLLLARGLTGKQVASRFNRSPRWLRMQVHAVKKALGVSTCAAAISKIVGGGQH